MAPAALARRGASRGCSGRAAAGVQPAVVASAARVRDAVRWGGFNSLRSPCAQQPRGKPRLPRMGGGWCRLPSAESVRGCPCPESRRCWPAQPWMAERRQHRESGAQDWRSDRPATGHGQPRASVSRRALPKTSDGSALLASVARDGGAQTASRERSPGWAQRSSGDGPRAALSQRQPDISSGSAPISASRLARPRSPARRSSSH